MKNFLEFLKDCWPILVFICPLAVLFSYIVVSVVTGYTAKFSLQEYIFAHPMESVVIAFVIGYLLGGK